MTKKWSSELIFGRENGNFFPKKRHSEILVREKFSVLPKLGGRSPPLLLQEGIPLGLSEPGKTLHKYDPAIKA